MRQQPVTAEHDRPVSPLEPVLPAGPGDHRRWYRLYGSGRGLALAQAARRHPGPLLVLTPDVRSARQLEDELRFYLSGAPLPVLPFPDWECLPYDAFSPHQDIVSQRLLTLYNLPSLSRGIILAPVATLMVRLPPPEYVLGHSFVLDVGVRLDRDGFRERLARAGYRAVSQVLEPGEFAFRGGLIDLFPMGSAMPFRIDLLDDLVESIREFDPESQRSGEGRPGIRLLPAREYPLTEAGIQQFRQGFRARFEGDPQRVSLYRDVSQGLAPAGIEYYLPLFFATTATFFDYLPAPALCVLDEAAGEAAEAFQREIGERYAQLRHDRERPVLAPAELFLEPAQLFGALKGRPRVSLVAAPAEAPEAEAPPRADAVIFDARPPGSFPVEPKAERPYRAFLEFLKTYPGRVLLVAETLGRRETLRALLQDQGAAPTDVPGWADFLAGGMRLGLTVAELEKGLVLGDPAIAVVTEPQLYGERAAQRRRRAQAGRDPEAVIRNLAELRVGDPVVHEEHGVGRYLGLQTLDVGDGATEFLALEYAGGDKLYIPVVALHLITRYTGTDPEHAPLHRLGGDAWEKAKERARQKAHDAAAELLEIYALRAARRGRAFPIPEEAYGAFADAFPFEETPDQARAIEDVLQGMAASQPMDRLVCGDVGFGKTEVAMRAAFAAVSAGAQVAVLVPTTLLAQQHYQNFRDRFAGLPVRVELLSRFRAKAEQTQALADLAAGRLDIVIGTHRLLQDDVRFRDLGLVIIDEEHRFGVRQKERLKKLRAEVDILTLTATPIPRTLNFALSGLRDISIIATPPAHRLSVKTFVTEWNDALVREACLREIRRGGQVYFLHNEVKTMDRALARLQALVPEAEIRMAHGQMPERELERIMLDFYHQRFNILLCSTIIESGIDVPSANTIVIERADKFGLAQLHQLRGRVGRSHHRAYAYLVIPPRAAITEDARKRLEALESLGDLGAGFALASHDLEIRGAGELLGESQSGEIDEVGYTLYTELLKRAVKSLQAGQAIDLSQPVESGTVINVHAPALLPADYLPDVHMRLILYKRIASADDDAGLESLQEEAIDRFGLLPPAAKLLFQVTALKLRATPLGIRKIDAGPKGARIEFSDKPAVDPGAIIRLLQSAPRTYRLEGASRLRIIQDMPEVAQRLAALQRLLAALA